MEMAGRILLSKCMSGGLLSKTILFHSQFLEIIFELGSTRAVIIVHFTCVTWCNIGPKYGVAS